MSTFDTLAGLLTPAAAFAYVNHRWIRQLASIALMAMALGLSLALLGLDRMGWVDVKPLRGGISVALSLSLPPCSCKDLIVTMTYAVVAFSILVQGPTQGKLAGKFAARVPPRPISSPVSTGPSC